MTNEIHEVKPFFDFYHYAFLKDIDLAKVEDECFKLKELDKGRTVSNAHGWQSNDIDFGHNCGYHLPYTSHLKHIIGEMVNTIGDRFNFYPLKLSNMWFNVNYPGCYNISHVHPGSVFSGVFYINCPQNSGNLLLHRDVRFMDYMHGSFKEEVPATASTWSLKPKPGHLVVFPSYLLHSVTTNLSNSDRISLSFNYVRNCDNEI